MMARTAHTMLRHFEAGMSVAESRAPENRGVVTSVRGSVVDLRFEGPLPPIHSVLHAGIGGGIVVEVLTQRDPRHVRGVTLTTQITSHR